MDEFANRKNIRLKNFSYSSPGAYFVTICTDKRKNYFQNGKIDPHIFTWESIEKNCVRPQNLPLSNIGRIVTEELEHWDQTYAPVSLYSYVIMPNHLHIMVVILADEYGHSQASPSLERMVKQFKGAVTKKIGKSIWQKSFMEHVIRNQREYEEISKYIYNNPLRWHYDELFAKE